MTRGGKKKDGTQTRYFSCTGKSHNRVCGGTKNPIYAEELESTVNEMIYGKIKALNDYRRKKTDVNSAQINNLKNRASEINREQDKIVGLLINDEIETDMIKLLNEKARKLSCEKGELLSEIDDLENQESEIISISELSDKWKTATYEEKKATANVLIHKIIIDQGGNMEVIWNI